MEKKIGIQTSDGKKIYGKLRGSLDWPLIVFVHGLGGNADQQIYFLSSRIYEYEQIATFRFNLYDWEDDSRNLSECTVKLHAEDFDTVVSYFREQGVKTIIAVGHSLGGPSILLSKNRDFEVLVLWDPSYDTPFSYKGATFVKELDAYKTSWNFDVLLNKEMIEEGSSLKELEHKAIGELNVPVKIISAEYSPLAGTGEEYFKRANDPKEHITIKGSEHLFTEDGVTEQLFDETLSWIKQNLRDK